MTARKSSFACLAVTSFFWTMVPAWGQQQGEIAPPPSIETNSPGGVDMTSGAYSMSTLDLQIGGEAFPKGLSLVRSYNSGTGQDFSHYAGYYSQGWSHNWAMRVSYSPIPADPNDAQLGDPQCPTPTPQCTAQTQEFFAVVSFGNGSAKFTNGQTGTATGSNIPGDYIPYEDHNRNQKLRFIGDPNGSNHNANGHFEFTDSDGTLYVFNPAASPSGPNLGYVVAPNGVRADVTYSGTRFQSIVTSTGYAIIFDDANGVNGDYRLLKACVVNLAESYVNPTGSCPASAPTVTYAYSDITLEYRKENGTVAGTQTRKALTSVADVLNNAMVYQYDDGGHVACVKDPGQTQCRISMTYSTCLQDNSYASGTPGAIYSGLHLSERVLRQDMATGEYWTYNYNPTTDPNDTTYSPTSEKCPRNKPSSYGSSLFTDSDGKFIKLYLTGGKAKTITDALGRLTQADHGYPGDIYGPRGAGQLRSQTLPEGNKVQLGYDARGNLISSTAVDKAGSTTTQIVTSATYAASCTDTTRKTCNKPVMITDGRGNVTDYEYAAAHGGLTRVRGPAVGGVRPETRYSYGQRYAWIKTSGGGYQQAASPVWVLESERSCTNSAMDAGGNCANGGDLVITTYDYGPASGAGNNLLLRGMAVTAAGQTLRTCYTYDALGRRTSETPPRADLGSCS